MIAELKKFNEAYEAEFGKIIPDGVTNEEAFLKASKKILWIMKEANDKKGGGWTLTEFHKNVTTFMDLLEGSGYELSGRAQYGVCGKRLVIKSHPRITKFYIS